MKISFYLTRFRQAVLELRHFKDFGGGARERSGEILKMLF